MGENYFALRQMPQAEQEYREAWLQRPDIPGLQLELGLVYAGTEQWDKAEEAFRAEANRQPGNAEAAYRLGTALLQRGKAQEARAELQRADKLQPDLPETLYSLGKPRVAVRRDTATLHSEGNQEAVACSPQRPGAARSDPTQLAELRNSPPPLWCFAPVPFLSPV